MDLKPGWLKRQIRIAEINNEEAREAKKRAKARILEELGPNEPKDDHSYDFDREYGLK